jgi:hypothetical protein
MNQEETPAELRARLEEAGVELPEKLTAEANPLLDAIGSKPRARPMIDGLLSGGGMTDEYIRLFKIRPACCVFFAWAVPTVEALSVIARHGPVVEMGAGTGYWSALLRLRGVDVLAYDIAPGDNEQAAHMWTEVEPGTPEILGTVSPARNLLLCWPPYDEPMASECLESFRGRRIIYVGEGDGGCTGDDGFHRKLFDEFTLEQTVSLPQWPGIHDRLGVWARKEESK